MSAPVFVVVGHVNRGKSSVVSTLAADDSVRIDKRPGTTLHCRDYPMRVGGRTLYTLVDTPGFERPRHVLAWLKQHETSTAERRAVVEQFVREHRGGDRFRQECELLAPILAGAAVLYVVDGSQPPTPKYEAEMEILRWTAQPRVALINATGREDYADSWRNVLDQFFNMVRPFNAHQADFERRIRLLEMLREMSDATRATLDEAIRCLIDDRRATLHEAASAVAEMMISLLTRVDQQRLAVDEDPAAYREALAARYYENLRDGERACHERLKGIFSHHHLQIAETQLDALGDDLFNLDTWNRLGLTRNQLAAAGAAAGAVAGGMIDAASAAISFPFGTLIGGAAGGAASWYAATKLPEVKVQGIAMGGQLLKIGPMRNPNFPWILLDRALIYLDVVARRAHARREQVQIDVNPQREGIVTALSSDRRKAVERQFALIRKTTAAEALDQICGELTELLDGIVRERYEVMA